MIFLDTNILSYLTNPNENQLGIDITSWLERMLSRAYVVSSDICDYEIRRSLLFDKKKSGGGSGLNILEEWRTRIDFLPVNHNVFVLASELWAENSVNARPNKAKENIDVDIIIAAQWRLLQNDHPGQRVVLVTENIRDFHKLCDVDLWRNVNF